MGRAETHLAAAGGRQAVGRASDDTKPVLSRTLAFIPTGKGRTAVGIGGGDATVGFVGAKAGEEAVFAARIAICGRKLSTGFWGDIGERRRTQTSVRQETFLGRLS